MKAKGADRTAALDPPGLARELAEVRRVPVPG